MTKFKKKVEGAEQETTLGAEVILTEAELLDLCTDWLKILDIRHWNVALRVCRASEMKLEASCGVVSITYATLQALISILDPIDFTKGSFFYDMEQTLVHELLHLKFAFLDYEEEEISKQGDLLLEQSIDSLAKTLVRLKREGEIS